MPMKQTLRETFRLIGADIAQRCHYENKPASAVNKLKLLFNPGVLTLLYYRWQVFFYDSGLVPLAGMMQWLNTVLFTCAYHSRTRIAGGLVVVHADSIWIGEGVEMGPGCVLFHQNAIGRSPFLEGEELAHAGAPIIEANVIFGAGACAHGPIRIGEGSRIAVNSLVETDVPPGSTMFGVPARRVSKS